MRLRVSKLNAALSAVIRKDDYFAALADEFRGSVLSSQAAIFEEHIPAVLEASTVDLIALEQALGNLDADLGTRLAESVREDGARITQEAYSRGMVDVIGSADWEFNVTDRLALHYLEDTEIVHWVGAHWGDKVSSKIVEAVSPAFTEGWTRLKLIEKLKEAFAGEIRRSDSYWSGLANNAVTRSRNFGLTEAASQAGFQRGTIVAFIDDRTSDQCRWLNGKHVLVSDMRQLRDSIITAPNPEAVKELASWLSLAELKERVGLDGRLPVSHSLPPYHFHCRTFVLFL